MSHYVTPGSALDREAYKRGTSVYLLDRVLPMLPEALSNGLCSLNPDVDRLTMSCMMELNDDAQVLSYKVFPSVIHSHARLVYDDVSRLLTEGDEAGFTPELAQTLRSMNNVAKKMRAARFERGALDLDAVYAAMGLENPRRNAQ